MNEKDLLTAMNAMRRLGLAFLWAVFICAVVSSLASCSVQKKVEKEVAVHDTVILSSVDTVHAYHEKIVRDSLRTLEKHIVTVNQAGDTVHTDRNFYYYRTVYAADSFNLYKARADSLQRIIDRYRAMMEKKSSKPPWIPPLICGLLIIVILVLFRHSK